MTRTADLRQTMGGLLLIGGLLTVAIATQIARDRAYSLTGVVDRSLYVTSGAGLSRMVLGFRALAADVYWMRTLQYFGAIQHDHRVNGVRDVEAARREYDALYPLLDLTTTLDPNFNLAYRFGAIFLSERPPGGPGRADLAVKLLDKGIQARPDRWEYLYDQGFVHYWWNHDYQKAGDSFERASAVSGAPWWLKPLAATTLAEGGDRRSSRIMFLALRDSAEIDWMRTDAERRLKQLDAMDALDALQVIVMRYAEREGHPPDGWGAIVKAGLLRGIPLDPEGKPFDLVDGRVRLARDSSLLPLPEEPKRLAPVPR